MLRLRGLVETRLGYNNSFRPRPDTLIVDPCLGRVCKGLQHQSLVQVQSARQGSQVLASKSVTFARRRVPDTLVVLL